MGCVQITDTSVEYERADGQKVLAVDNVSITIQSGEFVSLVGPSGCGKTTLLKAVNGLVPHKSGTITLDGVPMAQHPRERATVFQEASLFPWYTVARNVGYGLECRGMSRRKALKAVQPVLELVGLDGFGSHYPYEISGGMQQRANLARALVVDPQVLLMDEPFAALDAQTREMMQEELLRVWQSTKKTVMFITHQINEAIYLSDRVVVMTARPGRVLADVTVDLERPRPLSIKRTDEFLKYEDEIWKMIEEQARINMRREDRLSAGEH
jgi:NitT/TauT family transport system ATP-binding protein